MRYPTCRKQLLGFFLLLGLMGGSAAAQGMGKGGSGQGAAASEHGRSSSNSKGTSTGSQKKTPGELLQKNPKLSSKLQDLLPSGTDLQQAAAGFKNLGQFAAALHVAHNLGIPFDRLKAQMVDSRLSLGQAIRKLKPDASAASEARKGAAEGEEDLQQAGLLKKKP